MKIAAWSGPRNLSTAMMYSFGSRQDTEISDEPFYAAYLYATGLEHPMRTDILKSQPHNPGEITAKLMGAIPNGKTVWYQKLICNHMIEGISLEWAKEYKNIFIIRHPTRVIASYAQKRENPDLNDIGFVQQAMIYEKLGGLVIESADILSNPKRALQIICAGIDLSFDSNMLSWPKEGNKKEGIWASHWYNGAHASTSFSTAESQIPKLNKKLTKLQDEAMPFYEKLLKHKLDI